MNSRRSWIMDLLIEMQAKARTRPRPVVNAQAYPEDHELSPEQQKGRLQAHRLAQYLKHVRKGGEQR